MAAALELLNQRLPNLPELYISLVGGWGDNPQPWRALGAASGLTRLEVFSQPDVAVELTMGHLSALSGISSSLQALVITAERLIRPAELQQQQHFVQDYVFLSALTALTQLMLPLPLAAVNLAAERGRGGERAIENFSALVDITPKKFSLRGPLPPAHHMHTSAPQYGLSHDVSACIGWDW
jgi:hypothetical protein